MILNAALMCLALNVYHEARGEPVVGQHAVAQVTLRRAQERNKPICDVVAEKKQFSWANRLPRTRDGRINMQASMFPKDPIAWGIAWSVARMNIRGRVRDLTGGATHYHTVSVHPRWGRSMRIVARYGGHTFYRMG